MWDTQKNAIQETRWLGDYVGSSFGPNGFAKILMKNSDDFVITSDGVLILEMGSLSSPTTQILIETAKTLRSSAGDGVKSTVILTCELLNRAEKLLDSGVHPNTIAAGFDESARNAVKILEGLGQRLEVSSDESLREVVETILSSRYADKRDLAVLSSAIVQAARTTSQKGATSNLVFNPKDVFVKGIAGGDLRETKVIDGIVIDKEVELGAPKSVRQARIALLRSSIDIEKTEWDVEVKLLDMRQIEMLLSDESKIILDKLNTIATSRANVVLCERGIHPLVRQFLGNRKILAAAWIAREDMNGLAKATGGTVVADISDLSSSDLGQAELVEEQSFAEKKMLIVQGCKNPKNVTMLVRGSTEKAINEAKRCITQALISLSNLLKHPRVAFGGGATEAELATQLRRHAKSLGGKERAVTTVFADALDSIPVTLIRNSGGNILEQLASLRAHHQKGEPTIGIDAYSGSLVDVSLRGLVDPLAVKTQVIRSASEAAATILSVDEVLTAEYGKKEEKKEKSEQEKIDDDLSAREALEANISAVRQVVELVKKSLGPNGMMKLMIDNIGDARATGDGVTILKFIYAQHPAVRLLVDAAESHSKNFGDGTKTLIIMAGELLSQAQRMLSQGIKLPAIRRGYGASADLVTNKLGELSRRFDLNDRNMLGKIIETIEHENLVQTYPVNKADDTKRSITNLILDAFMRIREEHRQHLAKKFDINKIKLVKKTGPGIFETRLAEGYIVDGEVASNEMPKLIEKAKIAMLDCWLGIARQTLRRETRIQIHDPASMRDYLESASTLTKEIADKIITTGANVIFCSKRTDERTRYYLTKARILVVEAVSTDDIRALSELTGATIISDLRFLDAGHLGEANLVEERDIHGSKLVFVEGCPHKGYNSIFIRGSIAPIVDEAERILRKTIMTLVQLSIDPRVVPGGGSSELKIANWLSREAKKVNGHEQFAMLAYSSALEGIARTLCENAGFDPAETLKKINANTESATETGLWDPCPQKIHAILSATNTANVILKLGHIIEPLKKLGK